MSAFLLAKSAKEVNEDECQYIFFSIDNSCIRHVKISARTLPRSFKKGGIKMAKRGEKVATQERLRQSDKELRELLDYYLFATLHLYGIIELTDFLRIIQQHHGVIINENEFSYLMSDWMEEKGDYFLYKNWIVDKSLRDSLGDIDKLAQKQAQYTRYLPDPFEYVLYADDDYTDNPYLGALSVFLRRSFDLSTMQAMQLIKISSKKMSAKAMCEAIVKAQPSQYMCDLEELNQLVANFYPYERRPELLGNRPVDFVAS